MTLKFLEAPPFHSTSFERGLVLSSHLHSEPSLWSFYETRRRFAFLDRRRSTGKPPSHQRGRGYTLHVGFQSDNFLCESQRKLLVYRDHDCKVCNGAHDSLFAFC